MEREWERLSLYICGLVAFTDITPYIVKPIAINFSWPQLLAKPPFVTVDSSGQHTLCLMFCVYVGVWFL